MKTSRILFAILFAGAFVSGTCNEYIELENGVAGYRVTAFATNATGGNGTAADPYDLPTGTVNLDFVAVAFDQRGMEMPDYNGEVTLKVMPGELVNPSQRVTFTGGNASGTVPVRKVFGRIALWLEDIHLFNGEVVTGGSKPIQLKFRDGSYATGVSNHIYFDPPTLKEAQYSQYIEDNENTDTSALADQFIEFNCRAGEAGAPFDDGHGQLVVTGIYNEGFYATDVAGDGAFNHLYVYNYSYPDNLEIGDRLDRLVGTSEDFSGCTQISFPSWLKATDENHDPEPFRVDLEHLDTLEPDLQAALAPRLLTTAICNISNTGANSHLCGHSKYNWTIEAMEGARARLENVRAPDVMVNCDFNGDRNVVPDWLDASDPEAICSVACVKRAGTTITVKELVVAADAEADVVVDPEVVCPWEASIPGIAPHCKRVQISADHVCTELSTMRQFGQWVVSLDDGAGPLVNVVSNESLVEYDPSATENLGRTIEFLQGNLHQVRAARPRWMLYIGKLAGDIPPGMKP